MTQASHYNDTKGNTSATAKNIGKKALRDRTVTLSMSFPKAFFCLFFSLFVLVWVFIFGIMLGRGHNPEEVVPKLAQVMPAPATPAQNTPGNDIGGVIPSQDLKYHDSLKGAGSVEKPRATVPQPATPASAKPSPAVALQSSVRSPATKTPSPVTQAAPPAINGNTKTTTTDAGVYNYVYQVAAFNNMDGAETMRKKLEKGGLTARVAQSDSNGVTWYRIMVAFKGSPEDTRKLRTQLASLGIAHIILRGKTPTK